MSRRDLHVPHELASGDGLGAVKPADCADKSRAISFTIGRSDGAADGIGLARKGIDPRAVDERTIQAVAAEEAARQGLDAIAYAEGYGTGLAQSGEVPR